MTRQLFRHDSGFGYRFIPELKARVPHEGGGYLLRTNTAGFRCRHEVEGPRPPDVFRLLLFGDSYTAGDGVSDRDRYGDVLEKLVPGVQVLNFGLPGSGTDQQYLVYREFAAVEHDLVVVGVLVENIRRVVARFRPFESPAGRPLLLAKPYFELDAEADQGLRLGNVPVPRRPIAPEELPPGEASHVDRGGRLAGLRRVVNRFGPGAKDRIQRLTRVQPLPEYGRAGGRAWQVLKAILHSWIRETRVPMVIVPIPLYQYVEGTASPRAYQARFAELAHPPWVTIHDPLPDFLRFPRAERRRFRFERDCHLTKGGHRVLAQSLARCVARLREAQ